VAAKRWGERTGPPTLWYLGNVDGPRCHANQVVPATGLVDDAITTARKKGIVDQAGKPDLSPCRGNGFPAIRRRLTHGRVRYKAGGIRREETDEDPARPPVADQVGCWPPVPRRYRWGRPARSGRLAAPGGEGSPVPRKAGTGSGRRP